MVKYVPIAYKTFRLALQHGFIIPFHSILMKGHTKHVNLRTVLTLQKHANAEAFKIDYRYEFCKPLSPIELDISRTEQYYDILNSDWEECVNMLYK